MVNRLTDASALGDFSGLDWFNGKILQGDVPFKEGQNFSKGDVLIKIYNNDAEASIKASRSNFLRTLSLILPDMMVDYPDSYPAWKDFFNLLSS